MQLEKKYEFTHGRQLWRLIPDASGKLVIEERNPETKEVYFNCLDINTGKENFSNFQLDEKFWIGIEAVEGDIIFFHKYQKPEMPGHKGIIAVDIASQKTIWTNTELSFLFIRDEKVYCFEPLFEGRKFYTLDCKTGEVIDDLGNDAGSVNALMEEANSPEKFKDYVFPDVFEPASVNSEKIKSLIEQFRGERVIAGRVDFAVFNSLLLFNAHEVMQDGKLRNILRAIDLGNETVLIDQVLNKSTETFIPDAFFIKGDLLFLLIEKVSVVVYKIKS